MPVPLPVGTRLLHIGPQKTGTTTLQGAFHTNREALAKHGVHYAGKDRQARVAAAAVVLGHPMPGHPASSLRRWPKLIDEVRASSAERVVISAEMFANADDDTITEIVDAFGPATHVVLTLRPLVKILPSQWQQYVQDGLRASYDTWLDTMFNHFDGSMTPRFWRRHRHDELAARWAAAVGPERVTVIALDEQDRTMNLRSFERLLALPEGILVPTSETNRSFSLPEIELIRELNHQYQAKQWPKDVYERMVRYGMAYYLREAELAGDEPKIVTPQWAAERADAIAAEIIAGLESSGVNVMGDLVNLRPALTAAPADPPRVDSVDLATAARAVMGILDSSVIKAKKVASAAPRPEPGADTTAWVATTPSSELLRVVAGRARKRLLPRKSS